MNNYEVYDAISRIDERFTARADALRCKCAAKKPETATKNAINVKMLTRIAAAVVTFIFAFSAVTVFLTVRNTSTEAPVGSPTEAAISANAEEPLHAKTIQVSNIDETEYAAGKTDKASAPPYFSMISVPSVVRNNSEFTFQAGFGLSYAEWLFGLDTYRIDERWEFFIGISDFSYEVDGNWFYSSKISNEISLFGRGGEYKEYFEYVRLEELKFDPGRVFVVEKDGIRTEYSSLSFQEIIEYESYKIEYKNIKDVYSLPYQITVPCVANIINNKKGWFSIVFCSRTKDGSFQVGNGTKVFYYCSGDYIGFGNTQEGAYENAFYTDDTEELVEAIDSQRQRDGQGYEKGFCY